MLTDAGEAGTILSYKDEPSSPSALISVPRRDSKPCLSLMYSQQQQWEPREKGWGSRRGLIRQADRKRCLACCRPWRTNFGKYRTKPGQGHQVEALPAVPPPLGAHAAANLKFAFLPPARALGPPPRAPHWWVSRPILASGGGRGEGAEGASRTGTEAGEVGRAETRGCSPRPSPDGAGSGWQEPAKMTCSSELSQARG